MSENTQVNATPDNVLPIVDTPEVEAPIARALDKAFDEFQQLNTVVTEKDIYKPEHIAKKFEHLIASIEEGTGIKHPSRVEAETFRAEVDALRGSLEAKEASLADLTKYKTETETKLSEISKANEELAAKLKKFEDAKFGKFDDSEGLGKHVDHKAVWNELLKSNPLEATKYWNKHIEPK